MIPLQKCQIGYNIFGIQSKYVVFGRILLYPNESSTTTMQAPGKIAGFGEQESKKKLIILKNPMAKSMLLKLSGTRMQR